MHRIAAAACLGLMTASLLATPGLAASDEQFIKDAINGNNSEIALGKLALTKARAQGVRAYADTLVSDHTKANIGAKAAAKELGVKPPVGMSKEAKAEYTKLKGLVGPAFDQEFVSFMVDDHKKDIAEFQDQAKTGGKTTAAMAKKALPTLEQHLSMAEDLASKG